MHTRGTGMQPVFPHPGGGFIHIVHHVIHNSLLFGPLPLCITRPRRWTCRAKNCIILHTPFFAQSGGGWPAVRAPRPDHARACAGGLAFPWRAAASAQRERRAACRALRPPRPAPLPRSCAVRAPAAPPPRPAPPLRAKRAPCHPPRPAPLPRSSAVRAPAAPPAARSLTRSPPLCAPPRPAPPPAAPRGEKALRPPGSPQKDITPPGETHCAGRGRASGDALRGKRHNAARGDGVTRDRDEGHAGPVAGPAREAPPGAGRQTDGCQTAFSRLCSSMSSLSATRAINSPLVGLSFLP